MIRIIASIFVYMDYYSMSGTPEKGRPFGVN